MDKASLATGLLLLTCVLLIISCSKRKDAAPVNNNTTNSTTVADPYYARFTLGGVADTIKDDSAQSYSGNTNAIYGAISSDKFTLFPSFSLRFSLPAWYDTVTESQVTGLAGKTMHFYDTVMRPEIEYQANDTADMWYTDYRTDSTDYVKVDSVVFLAADNYQGHPVRKYAFMGSFKAHLDQSIASGAIMAGSFKMIITRATYK